MQKPVIFILTKEVSLYDTFRDNLREIFGRTIQLRSNHFPPVNLSEVDLILSSGSESLHNDFSEIANNEIPFVTANRSIDFNKLEKLLDLPNDSTCLLVSNELPIAEESVLLLNRLGFDYLDIVPYAPGTKLQENLGDFDVAITHGLRNLVPEETLNVIDLGNRNLDLSTIFEISRTLGLSLDETHVFTMDYFRNFVRIGRRLSNSVQNEKWLNNQLETVLDSVHEGIIWVDEDGIVTVFNEEAAHILGTPANDVIGKHYSESLRDLQIDDVMHVKHEIPRQVVQVRGLQMLITKTPILMENVFSGAVITFLDVTNVQRMEEEIRKKKIGAGLVTKYTFQSIIGNSAQITKTKTYAQKLAKSDYTTLIMGETGTGKELFAQAIHAYSARSTGPFVAVNFAGITQALAESELFGYEEGAFTGAKRGGKVGLFELAQNGTVFLDEIGDAPLNIQAAILRVLQERQVMRVGGNKIIPINVRVIAATNKNLHRMIQKGEFREDLFYRLTELPLEIPPLRERPEDIETLIDYFLQKRKIKMTFSDQLLKQISTYHWPGNVRELEAFINYLTVTVDGVQAGVQHLPKRMMAEHYDDPEADFALRYLENSKETTLYKEILEKLYLANHQQSGLGRGSILALLDMEISDSQLRTKLNTLRTCKCITVGTKKQGTKITRIGISVLERL